MRLLVLLIASVFAAGVEVPATVLAVPAGDIVVVRLATGERAEVRLLYVMTPVVSDPAPAKGLDAAAAAFLAKLLPQGAKVRLKAPGTDLSHDRDDRLLAVVWSETTGYLGAGGTDHQGTTWYENVNSKIITAGWSVYWQKHGADPDEKANLAYQTNQSEAEDAKAGAWSTAPGWMQEMANERATPSP